MDIHIANRQEFLAVDEPRLTAAARQVLADAGYIEGLLSLAIVNDATIHDLNATHLEHNYPTDVLSFLLSTGDDPFEAEVVVSAETARRRCSEFGLNAHDELLLYVIHGVLHLAGYNDKSVDEAATMQQAEARYLAQFGSAADATHVISSPHGGSAT